MKTTMTMDDDDDDVLLLNEIRIVTATAHTDTGD